MAGGAIKQLGAFDRVICGPGFVTVDAPTHVDGLLYCGYGLFTHIAVTVFAVQASCDVWPVIEMHKIRHLVNWNPIDGLVFLYICA